MPNGQILAQLAPLAATLTDFYQVNPSNRTNTTALFVCNRGALPTSFRIAVAKGGEADDVKHYLYFDVGIQGNATFLADLAMTLNATDVMRVYATLATLTFTLFGEEGVG